MTTTRLDAPRPLTPHRGTRWGVNGLAASGVARGCIVLNYKAYIVVRGVLSKRSFYAPPETLWQNAPPTLRPTKFIDAIATSFVYKINITKLLDARAISYNVVCVTIRTISGLSYNLFAMAEKRKQWRKNDGKGVKRSNLREIRKVPKEESEMALN